MFCPLTVSTESVAKAILTDSERQRESARARHPRGSTVPRYVLAGYGTFASLAGITDFSDKSAAAAGLPPVDSVPLWPYLSGAQPHSPRTVVELGSCATSDKGNDAFCGKRGTNTTVQGLIKDERQAGGGGLWKVLVGSVWQAGWTGPEFPNNTKNPAGKMNAFFGAFYC